MRGSTKLQLSSGAVLSTGLMVAALFTAPAADVTAPATQTTGPQMLAGEVVDEDGSPFGGAEIAVYVEEERKSGDYMTMIAEGHTNPAGRFVIRGGLEGATHTVNPDRSVTLQVAVDDGVDTKFFDIDARPPAPRKGRPDWSWGGVVDSMYLPASAAPQAQARAGKVLEGLRLDLSPGADTDEGMQKGKGRRGANELALMKHSNNVCSSTAWRWIPDTARFRWTPNTQIYQYNRTKMAYHWETTKETKLQIGYTGEGTVKGVPYKGGLSYANGGSASSWVDMSFPQKGAGRRQLVKTQWRYQKQKLMCYSTISGMNGTWSDTGHRRFKARSWTGGNKPVDYSKTFTCPSDHITKTFGTVGYKNTKTERWEAFINIAGLQLDSTQQNTKATFQTVGPGGGFAKAKICGKQAMPAESSLIREYPWG